MLENLYNNIFNRKDTFSSYDDFTQFENHRVNINVSRVNICTIILLPLMIFLSFFDILYYSRLLVENKDEIYIFISHISLVILCISWFFYYKILYKRLKFIYNRCIYWTFSNLIICVCTLIGIFNHNSTPAVSSFIMIIFVTCAVIYIPPAVSIPTFGISYMITTFFIIITDMSLQVKISNFINSSITIIFSLTISYNLYLYFLGDYKKNLELIRTNKKLAELESNKSLYFTNFSHELKTPLNIIYSAQQMLNLMVDKDKLPNDNYHKYLNIVKQNTNQLTKLIQNLIDISKLESSCFKIKKVNDDIIKVVEDISLSAASYINDKGLSLIFDTDCEEKIITFDPDLIERIVLNLLSNAIKFTPKGGKILVSINTTKEFVHVSVKDTGIGIPENMQSSIFNRYTQIENKSKNKHGSGIGLALVKFLVELHDGTITVSSKVNEGSTFTFTLPNKTIENLPSSGLNLDSERNEKVNFEFSDIKK